MQRSEIISEIAQFLVDETQEEVNGTFEQHKPDTIIETNQEPEPEIIYLDASINNVNSNNTDLSPEDYTCPITLDKIRLPLRTPSGQLYEAKDIITWISKYTHYTCPTTRKKTSLEDLKFDKKAYYLLVKHPLNDKDFEQLCLEAKQAIEQLKANVKKPIDEELPASSGRVIGRWAIYNLFINEIVAACLAFGRIEENPASIFSSLILCDFILGLIGSLRNRRSEPMFTSLASGVINSTLHTYTPLPVAVNPIISSVSGAVGSVLSYSVYSFWRRNNPEESYQAQSQGENTINTLYGTFEQSNQP